MPNKRAENKRGVSIAIDAELKRKWQSEASRQGLTLTEYIIKQIERNYENNNNNSRKNTPESSRDS